MQFTFENILQNIYLSKEIKALEFYHYAGLQDDNPSDKIACIVGTYQTELQ